MPLGSTEEPTVEFTEEPSLAVRVVSSGKTKPIGAEFGRWHTVLVSSAVGPISITPGAQRLCNRSLRRKRLLIVVSATVLDQPSLDGVIIGSSAEINSGNPATPGALAGYLPIGTSIRWECQQELWVCYPTTNTDPVFVTTCDEQYASEQPEWRGSE